MPKGTTSKRPPGVDGSGETYGPPCAGPNRAPPTPQLASFGGGSTHPSGGGG